ncbi:pyruvate phosphate pep pyruvate binding domain-containing protein [Cystoisospora suis]|uniref:Pyruvate phosphate pep pyruvate binding domain-containing protein n=1 Tax=Cystoisospora suis TaxID=483139 RepID=A0A2C6LBP0_9APIC|nr:pyruvate phosphate pep pyruvate binding domain-containing protein [Cystoisospora suis]
MELKNEIKHSLQNKLHRCAGPEDLETAERLLHRFNSNPGAYSHDFILEFERFYDELKRFFNATDLEQRLRELRYQSNPRVAELIDRFLESKARCDDSTASLTKLLVALSVCLELRISLTCQLKDSGLISSSSTYRGQDLHQIQDLRLAEILLEDVAFLLLSRVENLLQDDPDDGRWPEAIEALCLAVHDVKISGIRRDECRALGSELSAHTRRASQMNEDWLMLKATLERCRRLCEDFTDLQIVLYSGRALALGNELKLPEHAVRVFSEATIRSSVVFQISKLCGDLLRRVRSILELQPYDALVCGEAVGEVRLYDTLEEGVLQCIRLNPSNIANERGEAFYSHHLNALNGDTSEERKKTGEDGNKDTNKTEKKKNRNVSDINEEDNAAPAIILAARCATGDEEVAGLDGPHGKVVGIVVGHDLPILSHLGVRARQRGGPFVACQEPGAFEPFVAAQGKVLSLSANSHSVTFEVLEGQKASDALELQRQRKTSQNMTGGRGAGRGAGFSGRSDEMVASMKMKDPSSFSSSDGGVSSPNYPFSSVISSSLLQDSSSPPSPLHIHDMRVEDCGAKASTCAMLRILCEESGGGADFSPSSSPSSFVDGMHANHHSTSPPPVFQAARCLAYRFGTMEWLIENQNQTEEFQKLIETMEKASPGPELDEATSQMQELILNLVLPEELLTPVVDLFGGLRSRLVVRSSANVEDLEGMSAAGLYESVANVSLGDGVAFQSAVVTVWASLYSRRAILARRAAGIPQHQACMAVLIQELVTPEYSFILHTVNPVDTQDVNHLYVEMAPGLGEVLAGGQTRGSPHRMLVNKSTGELTMLAFCNYSNALVPVMPRSKSFSTLRDGKAGQHAVASTSPSNLIKSKVMDYTMDILTQDTGYRVHIAHKLADVSVVLEAKLGGPQDVEGVASGDTIWIVQSRPQSM